MVRPLITLAFSLYLVCVSSQGMAFVFTDNFDDNSLNTFWWTNNSSGGSTSSEANNRLEMVQGSSGYSQLMFNYPVPGNFTAQVDYSLLNWPSDNQERIAIAGTFGAVERISDNGFGGERYLTHFVGEGVLGLTATSDMSGKLKFSRTGSTVSGYYWTGSAWQLIHSYGSGPTNDQIVDLQIWPEYPIGNGVKVAFDNFQLDAPSMVNPVPEPASLVLFGLGGIATVLIKRRRKA